jgi:hypothetical protein
LSRRPVHRSTRADLGAVALLIALVLTLTALIPAAASADPHPVSAGVDRGQGASPIYFWANLGYPVKTPVRGFSNPPVIRPSTFTIFEDGSWEIEKLHWTGWGSPVAKATGTSNADTDDPNVAEGKRILTPAKVTLYDPGTFGGRRVYRCIRIKLRKPASFPTSCLQRTGSSVGLSPPGTGTPVGNEADEEGAPGALKLAAPRPACTRRALTEGLRQGGLRGYIDGDTFGCAGRFAYAGVIVDGNEVTVLFRAVGRRWHPASRARFCGDGSVPKQIYQPACETN